MTTSGAPSASWPVGARELVLRANERAALGDLKGAGHALERCALLVPRDPWVLATLGNVLALQGDADGAVARLAQALDAEPGYTLASESLAALRGGLASGPPPLPPLHLRFMGESDARFLEIGDTLVRGLRDLAGLADSDRVLDIGSGYGRLAHALDRGGFRGTYAGMDILWPHVQWCREHLETRDPRYRFLHLDVANGRYNPGGTIDPSEATFPFDDGSFDLVCLTSVFTHMHERDIVRYLGEIRRLLADSGRCLATFFLLDDAWRKLHEEGRASIDMRHVIDDHTRCFRLDDPLHAIAYDEAWVVTTLGELGFRVRLVHHGSWSGRNRDEHYQDIVVLERAREEEAGR